MSEQLTFERVFDALRHGDFGQPLKCKRTISPIGDPGERRLSFEIDSFDRDLLDDVDYLISTITDKLDVPCRKLLAKRARDADGGGTDRTLVIGNTKGDPSTHWALTVSGFVPGIRDFDPAMDVQLLESKADIEQFIFKTKESDLIKKAQEIANFIQEATRMEPKKLLALRQALSRVEHGGEILRVWDIEAVGKELDATSPKARSSRSSARL